MNANPFLISVAVSTLILLIFYLSYYKLNISGSQEPMSKAPQKRDYRYKE